MEFEIACTTAARLQGLFGHEGFDGALLLVPCRDVHTFGMKSPLDIAFIGVDGTVIETHRDVGPRRRLKNRRACATLERYARPGPWLDVGDCILSETACPPADEERKPV